MESEPLMTREQTAEFLTGRGFPITKGTLEQYHSKKVGPPIAKKWGTRPLYSPSTVLAWAQSRIRNPEEAVA